MLIQFLAYWLRVNCAHRLIKNRLNIHNSKKIIARILRRCVNALNCTFINFFLFDLSKIAYQFRLIFLFGWGDRDNNILFKFTCVWSFGYNCRLDAVFWKFGKHIEFVSRNLTFEMAEVYFVGVDVGTGSVRAALVGITGSVHKVHVKETKTWNPAPDHYEQSSDNIWSCICECVRVNIDRENFLCVSEINMENSIFIWYSCRLW